MSSTNFIQQQPLTTTHRRRAHHIKSSRSYKSDEQQQLVSFTNYIETKRKKLFNQVHNKASMKSYIFFHISIYVNGYTHPTASHLRDLIVENGGEYHHYFMSKRTTYIIASVLSTTKWKSLGQNANIVVRPEWIVESVRANKRLPIEEFMLMKCITKNMELKRQLFLSDFTTIRQRRRCPQFSEKIKEKEACEIFQSHDDEKYRARYTNKNTTLNYARESDNKILILGKVQIDITKEVNKELIQKLVATYKNGFEKLDLRSINISVKFLERIIYTKQNVHPDFFEVMKELKKWINAFCMKKYYGQLFIDKT